MAKEKDGAVKVEDIMKMETVLPTDFDGVFRFTNWSDEEFIGIWGGKEYHFPPNSTSPMVIQEHSPLEVQHIRKKFAKNLAEREFFNSSKYAKFKAQETNPDGSPRLNSIHQAGQYSDSELALLIQRCLKPLPVSKATVTEAVKARVEDKLSKDNEGELNTQPINKDKSVFAQKAGI